MRYRYVLTEKKLKTISDYIHYNEVEYIEKYKNWLINNNYGFIILEKILLSKKLLKLEYVDLTIDMLGFNTGRYRYLYVDNFSISCFISTKHEMCFRVMFKKPKRNKVVLMIFV